VAEMARVSEYGLTFHSTISETSLSRHSVALVLTTKEQQKEIH